MIKIVAPSVVFDFGFSEVLDVVVRLCCFFLGSSSASRCVDNREIDVGLLIRLITGGGVGEGDRARFRY